MKANIRSASGAALMLLIAPAIVGLLACMPVPIGNPERSRIDPEISGVWVLLDSSDPGFYAFEPYDKRTWLLTGMPLEEGAGADFSDYERGTYSGFSELIRNESVGADGATTSEVLLYKAWRTKLGGVWFMTWEPKALFEEEGFEPDVWFVFRIDKSGINTLDLYMVDGEDEVFNGLDKTRRAYERVLRKNAKNKEIYADDPISLVRVRSEHLSFFEELADEVISGD